MRTFPLTALCTAMLLATAAAAFEVNPGKWQITSTTEMSMMPQPQTKTSTECLKEKTADEVLEALTQEDICKIKDHSENGATLKWSMECQGEGSPPMKASGELTSTGDTLNGVMNASMEMKGQKMTFKTMWKGKRLGECD
jgi:hypothetical protein